MQPSRERIEVSETHDRWTQVLIQERIHALGDWFHNLNLRGIQTSPSHFLGDYPAVKWKRFAHAIPEDLTGKTVLDIGCNAGFYALEMKKRGADRVLAIDSNEQYLEQARFAAEVEGVEIEFRKLSVYELPQLQEQFDLVLFLGVLYHLRHPLLALDIIRQHVAKDMLIVQSMLRGSIEVEPLAADYPFEQSDVFQRPSFPCMYFIEKSYSHDPTNWWIPNVSCLEAMIKSAGFEVLSHPELEVFVCRTVPFTALQKEMADDFLIRKILVDQRDAVQAHD